MNPPSGPPESGRNLALVVGVNYAPKAQDSSLKEPHLQHATEDAEGMANALEEYGQFELLHPPFLNGQANSGDIQDEILLLEQQSTKDDCLLFYFSGHGYPLILHNSGSAEVFLVTWDFSEDITKKIPDRRLSLSWLRDNLFCSRRAGKVVIILDCCYAGHMGRIQESIRHYMGAPNEASGSLSGGARQALAATGHTQTTKEHRGHGLMTFYLLPALGGKVDEVITGKGDVTLSSIHAYLERKMPAGKLPSLTGDNAGQKIVLAQHNKALRWQRGSQGQPSDSSIPSIPQDAVQRLDELEGGDHSLLHLLERGQEERQHIVGLIGRPGVGKTWLALELARYCEDNLRYPDGVFWMSGSGNDYATWLRELADLARRTNYLPPDDDVKHPENEQRRASHFCHYLAQKKDILLIIDNLENSALITQVLPDLAGANLNCTIIYTAAVEQEIAEASSYQVKPFTEQTAMTVLLLSSHSHILRLYEKQERTSEEVIAAMEICRNTHYLPLFLGMLNKQLEEDPGLKLTRLRDMLNENEHGVLQLSWDLLEEEKQQLFLLAVLFPAATAIPFWLLELAGGFSQTNGFRSFGRAYNALQKLQWITVELREKRIRLHQLQREFGLRLLRKEDQQAKMLKVQAAQHLMREFCNINRLQECTEKTSYWQCLEQVRQARDYARLLDEGCALDIERIERRLDRESVLLTHETWWPERLPALFYQQLYNRAVEEGDTLTGGAPPCWLHLERPIGAEDRALLRVFGGHQKRIRCVAFSPDGRQILTGSNDGTARLWESASGRLLLSFVGHKASVSCVAFSADGQFVVTGSDDETIRIWERHIGTLRFCLDKHTAGITSIACSTDGRELISGSNDRSVRIWDMHEGKQKTSWQAPMRIGALALAAGRQWIVIASGDSVWIWDRKEDRKYCLRSRPKTQIVDLALSPDERTLAIGQLDPPVVHLWDCEQGIIRQTLTGHTDWLNSLAFSPDGKWILTGANDETARLWDCESGRCHPVLMNHIGSVTSVAYAPDGYLLTGSSDHKARLWDEGIVRQTQKELVLHDSCAARTQHKALRAYTHKLGLGLSTKQQRRVILAPEGTYALLLYADNAEIWNTERRICVACLEIQDAECFGFSADGTYLLIGLSGKLEVRSCASGELRERAEEESRIQNSWSKYAAERIPLMQTPKESPTIIAPSGRYSIRTSDEGELICEDTQASEGSKDSASKPVPTEAAPITHLSFSLDEQLLLVGNTRGRIFFFAWNGRKIGSLLGSYQASDQVASVRWLHQDRVLIADVGPYLTLLANGTTGTTMVIFRSKWRARERKPEEKRRDVRFFCPKYHSPAESYFHWVHLEGAWRSR